MTTRPIRALTFTASRYDYDTSVNVDQTLSMTRCLYVSHPVRLSFIYQPPGTEGRRVTQGPMVPGPWTASYAQASVIDNHGGTGAEVARQREAGLFLEVEAGDLFLLDGKLWKLTDERRMSYPELVVVDV